MHCGLTPQTERDGSTAVTAPGDPLLQRGRQTARGRIRGLRNSSPGDAVYVCRRRQYLLRSAILLLAAGFGIGTL